MTTHTITNCKPCKTHTRRTVSFLVILTALVVAMQVLTACGSSSSPSPDAAPANTPVSIVGTWVSDDEPHFEAVVGNGQIVVSLVDGETKSLFWKGTFPDTSTSGNVFQSQGDVDAMYASMLGSSETVKPFTIKSDEITFEFSMMGTSTVVHVKKK